MKAYTHTHTHWTMTISIKKLGVYYAVYQHNSNWLTKQQAQNKNHKKRKKRNRHRGNINASLLPPWCMNQKFQSSIVVVAFRYQHDALLIFFFFVFISFRTRPKLTLLSIPMTNSWFDAPLVELTQQPNTIWSRCFSRIFFFHDFCCSVRDLVI